MYNVQTERVMLGAIYTLRDASNEAGQSWPRVVMPIRAIPQANGEVHIMALSMWTDNAEGIELRIDTFREAYRAIGD